MELKKRSSEISTLIDIGQKKGFLPYDEVNDMLPAEISAPEEILRLLERIAAAGILLSDEPLEIHDEEVINGVVDIGVEKEKVASAIRSGEVDKTTDPVRMYLREMGTHPLLDREGEVGLAQQMEAGLERSVWALYATPLALRLVLSRGSAVAAGSPLDNMVDVNLKRQTHHVLDSLAGREKEVSRLRYGMEDGEEHTLENVGGRFGLTRERIRQIESKALRKLRYASRCKQLTKKPKE